MDDSIDMNKEQVESYIISNVRKELGSLDEKQENYAIGLYRSMNPETFRGYKLSKVGPILGKVLSQKIKEKFAVREEKEFHEYQKAVIGSADQEVGVYGGFTRDDLQLLQANPENSNIMSKAMVLSEFMGINDLSEFKMLFNPESMLVHYYMVLDSNFRDTTEENPSAITRFTWKYAPTQFVGQGFCNSVGVIRDIVGMRMYQPRIPYLAAMNTDAKRVSVLIEEFAPQAFIAENGRRFHFLLRPNFITGQTDIELSTEDYNDGIFNFRKPITKIDSMTLSFGEPLNVLTFATPFNRFIVPFEFVCLRSDK